MLQGSTPHTDGQGGDWGPPGQSSVCMATPSPVIHPVRTLAAPTRSIMTARQKKFISQCQLIAANRWLGTVTPRQTHTNPFTDLAPAVHPKHTHTRFTEITFTIGHVFFFFFFFFFFFWGGGGGGGGGVCLLGSVSSVEHQDKAVAWKMKPVSVQRASSVSWRSFKVAR